MGVVALVFSFALPLIRKDVTEATWLLRLAVSLMGSSLEVALTLCEF
jgi:hypothetical protein